MIKLYKDDLLHLDMSTVYTLGPELHLDNGNVYTIEACAPPGRVYTTGA
jgi:hypothetical protein